MMEKFRVGDIVSTIHPQYRAVYKIIRINTKPIFDYEIMATLEDDLGEDIGDWSFDNLILLEKNKANLFEDFYDASA
jgi:hypothetical protein